MKKTNSILQIDVHIVFNFLPLMKLTQIIVNISTFSSDNCITNPSC